MVLWLPDSRLETLELLELGRKPVGPVKVDWEGDMCKSLSRLSLNNDYDMVSDTGVTVEVGTFTPEGEAVESSSPSDYRDHAWDNLIGATSATITFKMYLKSFRDWGTFARQQYYSDSYTVQIQLHQQKIYLYFRNNSTNYAYSPDILSLNTTFTLSVVYDGSAVSNVDKLKLYIDGKEVSLTYSGDVPTSLPNWGNVIPWRTGESFDGGIIAEMCHDLMLTNDEIFELHQDLYQSLIPA
ncbi:MAG: hypothetical protein GQ532_14940 [Methylomarinum sp.]|nr:hypothetical protein [Methylomarinum sp.]